MAKNSGQISLKRIGVNKTNTRIVVITSVAAFLVVFSVVASYNLVSQMIYQNKVIGVKKTAVSQLEQNIENTGMLVSSYKAFVSTPQNVIGGNPTGSGPNDGSNAKIVLDALPSKYDFPALANSLERLTAGQGLQLRSISGTDDEVAQVAKSSESAPQPVEVPFEMAVTGSYDKVRNAVTVMERSIRPFQVAKLQVSGDQRELTLTYTGNTYYQPEKTLTIQKKVVK